MSSSPPARRISYVIPPATLKQRSRAYGSGPEGKGKANSWEAITGWNETDEETDEEDKRAISSSELPFENAWGLDTSSGEPSLKLSFRQSIQSHSDWVNDILLCNFNRTVVSCSSDGTVKAWSPHDPSSSADPVILGRHSDYVRCLAQSRHQNWVASGSFDRTIKLWDLSSKRQEPIRVLLPSEANNAKSSVYALATDTTGSFLASGGPERVVRLWDSRSGKRTGKLVGHTDNIRSILISQDGRYLLTGSADASIKLWSLASSNRCIHTFAHHTDSVWSMYSSHPSLSIFYSGDRAGNICRVDMDGCASLSEGECVLLCKETPSKESIGTEGINNIIVLDDQFVWTATASSTINCWKVPPARSNRITNSPGDGEQEFTSSPTTFAMPISPFGIGLDSNQASTRGPQNRHSLNAEREGWTRSESPASLPDLTSKRMESIGGASPLHIPRGGSALSSALQDSNPSDTSLHTAGGRTPGVTSPPVGPSNTLFGIPYESLIKLSSPADGFVSPLFAKHKETDVATLYSAASIKSVPVPIRQFGLVQQHEPVRSQTVSHSQSGFRSLLRRSITSFEGMGVGMAISPGQMSGKNTAMQADEVEDAARLAYESREVAADAQPVRPRPDFCIPGTQGIVRSVVLNDRWHALTVDTMGHVGVWDIARGQCIGKYEKVDVEEALRDDAAKGSQKQEYKWSPREALEVVRERVEGEAVVQAWCTVDSSIGNLMVHIHSGQAFDAEIFADDAGYIGTTTFEEDHRLNIGKWVLGNLFAPFVAQEKLYHSTQDGHAESDATTSTLSPPGLSRASISRQGGPRHISLEARRIRSIAEMTASQRTPGISTDASTLPMTPAQLPDLPHDALSRIAAATADDSQHQGHEKTHDGAQEGPAEDPAQLLGSPTPKVPVRSQTMDEGSPQAHGHDYFSVRRRNSVGGSDTGNAKNPSSNQSAPQAEGESTTTPGSTAGHTLQGTPGALTPLTPSATSSHSTTVAAATSSLKFMGKLKAFGKPKKGGGMADIAESGTTQPAQGTADSDRRVSTEESSPPTFLQLLMSKPLNLPGAHEVPAIDINPMTGIMISQKSTEAASGWAPVYRGLHSTQAEEEDIDCLEHELPEWLLEFLLNNKVNGEVGGGGPSGAQKISFMVVPWKGADSSMDLPDLLSNQSKLTASRFLRVRKILAYIKDKVNSIEIAEKRKEAEMRFAEESETVPRAPSTRSLRTSSRSSQDGLPTRDHRTSMSKPPTMNQGTTPSAPPSNSHSQKHRPPSSSSTRSSGSNHHQATGNPRHRKSSRAAIEEEEAVQKKPEDLYELLCNDVVIPNSMTLAAVKHFRWKSGGELVMEYRRKQ
ncbi:hypothetical protein CPB86DRAFT_805384 [Serendipita vermifera]|nr:hypothetical protein CPB86DRAFT_805384 [Serendipita vermifera]